MKSYKQIEYMLYNHYEKINSQNKLKSSLDRTRKRIDEIKSDLKVCNFELSSDMEGIDYSREQVSTSEDNSSSMEKDLIREESKLERELEEEKRYKFSLKRKIRNLQKQIDHLEIILEQLPINYIEFVELIYKDKLTHRRIGMLINCDSSTVSRNRTNIVEILRKML